MAVVELRGPCGHLAVKLDTKRGIIERKCPQCSQQAGYPIFHRFDAENGRMLEATEVPGGAVNTPGAAPGKGFSDAIAGYPNRNSVDVA